MFTVLQACDGTVKGLHQALVDIGRTDAVAVVDRFLQDEAARAQSKPRPSPGMQLDSKYFIRLPDILKLEVFIDCLSSISIHKVFCICKGMKMGLLQDCLHSI